MGTRPQGKGEQAEKDALARSMLVVNRLAAFTHRPASAEAVGWDAVKQQPGAEGGVGLVVLIATPESK